MVRTEKQSKKKKSLKEWHSPNSILIFIIQIAIRELENAQHWQKSWLPSYLKPCIYKESRNIPFSGLYAMNYKWFLKKCTLSYNQKRF